MVNAVARKAEEVSFKCFRVDKMRLEQILADRLRRYESSAAVLIANSTCAATDCNSES
jgi:hypothetical protein